jgi:hypothetical protein
VTIFAESETGVVVAERAADGIKTSAPLCKANVANVCRIVCGPRTLQFCYGVAKNCLHGLGVFKGGSQYPAMGQI